MKNKLLVCTLILWIGLAIVFGVVGAFYPTDTIENIWTGANFSVASIGAIIFGLLTFVIIKLENDDSSNE